MSENQPTHDADRPLDPLQCLDEHGDALFRFAMLSLSDVSAAEDAVQETLLAAVAKPDRFRGESSPRTWLIGILKNKVADHIRKSSRNRAIRETDLSPDAPDEFDDRGLWAITPARIGRRAESAAENQEFWAAFELCRKLLPQQMAFAFCLREIDGLATDEICDILEITPTNLWTLLHRARSRLRHCLEANWFKRGS
jgi:RNA polymerase sigma-70 factor (ECF subfamily)